MLNVVCVHVGNYCGKGKLYIRRLFDGMDRHLRGPAKYWCITDNASMVPTGIAPLEADKNVSGWWNKISLFRPGILPQGERVLYFDLDTIITGDLDDIAEYRGKSAILKDFYHPQHMNSSVMAWEAGALDHIWLAWDRSGRPQFDPRGDQRFIEAMQPKADSWQDMLPGQIVSYKVDCQQGVPKDARVVCFHGRPRPHEIDFTLPQTERNKA